MCVDGPATEPAKRGVPPPVNDLASGDKPMVTVRIPLPADWLHPFSLVYACYGKTSERPDPDLNQSPSNGPEKKRKRKARDSGGEGSSWDGESDTPMDMDSQLGSSDCLSKRAIKMMGYVDDTHSLANSKRHKQEKQKEYTMHDPWRNSCIVWISHRSASRSWRHTLR